MAKLPTSNNISSRYLDLSSNGPVEISADDESSVTYSGQNKGVSTKRERHEKPREENKSEDKTLTETEKLLN